MSISLRLSTEPPIRGMGLLNLSAIDKGMHPRYFEYSTEVELNFDHVNNKILPRVNISTVGRVYIDRPIIDGGSNDYEIISALGGDKDITERVFAWFFPRLPENIAIDYFDITAQSHYLGQGNMYKKLTGVLTVYGRVDLHMYALQEKEGFSAN